MVTQDILARGAAALNRWRSNSMTRTVTYQRGSNSVDVPATPGDPAPDTGGEVPTWESRSFKINAADLVLGGVQIEPQIGDQIIETVGDGVTQVTYAVQPPAGRPVFDRVENWLAFRVHAMRVYELAEQVIYYPGGHLYAPIELPAQIDRSPEATFIIGRDAQALHLALRVPRGDGDGRLSEVKAGEDLVDVELLRDGKVFRFRIDRVISSDHPGFWRLGSIGAGQVQP